MKAVRSFTLITGLLCLMTGFSVGQGQQVTTGMPPFGSFGGGPFDTVNLGNLNVHFAIPVFHKAGRGMPFTYDLSYDSAAWYPVGVSGSQTWTPVFNWGWRGQTEIATGYLSYASVPTKCFIEGDGWYWGTKTSNYVYHDPWGVPHPFKDRGGICDEITLTGSTIDGSGYTIVGNDIHGPSGQVIKPPVQTNTGAGSGTDANGNQISVNASGQFTDTLGTTALTVAGTPPANVTLKYTSPSDALATVTIKYTTAKQVRTNFGCSGIGNWGPTTVPLVSEIDLPDGSKYLFDYETTPGFSGNVTGRINSVTLPTGGKITYTYSGGSSGHITCTDGTAATLQRALNPGGTWTYAHAQVSGTQWRTTVTDATPSANQTVVDFQKNDSGTAATNNFYETSRVMKQGSSTTLKTVYTCYNGQGIASPSTCSTIAVSPPILRRTVFTCLPTCTGKESESDFTYDSLGNGLLTELDEYDYGNGAVGGLIRKTITTYATLSNNIVDRPSSVVVKDGQGNIKASTTYSYDEGTVTATSGTPQHVNVSGSRGNLTTIGAKATGTTTLYRNFTYYDTGNLRTAKDVDTPNPSGGATTTYNYASEAASCYNSFVTSLTEPLSLSRSFTWDCDGGVLTSTTDENGKTSSTQYTDSYFWRPSSSTDQASNVTYFTYPSSNQSQLTLIADVSVVENLTTLDEFGRPHLSQTRQGPGSANYDSVETDYDAVGRVSKIMLPYAAGAGSECSGSCPGTTTTYDALDRPLTVADGGGGATSYTYTKNDVYQSLGPAPTGENSKDKQLEYDALGRLTSVCEITSGTGSGSCNQTTTKTGYWTRYTYDVLGDLTGVSQNAQGTPQQTRTYNFDMLGRLIAESNPEMTAGISYAYDVATGSCPSVANPEGNMVQRTDPVGNVTCYSHDVLHRVTSTTYPSGAYAGSTPNKYFVYDTATVNGVAMANAKGRLAEAYTCTSCPGTKLTDLGFSYWPRGEVAHAYQYVSDVGAYFRSTAYYWPNGVLKSLGLYKPDNSSLIPLQTYGVDGQGRWNTVSAAAGQNPVTSTSYNASGQVTGLTYGSGDSDSFDYYTNTGRMHHYYFDVDSPVQTVTGALTWNTNGTLRQLAIDDPINPPNTQTCTHGYDDLRRAASVNCVNGSTNIWNQTFTLTDMFGNVKKDVPPGGTGSYFLPTYNQSRNRISSLPDCVISYDANGNPLQDCARGTQDTYTWDAEGKATTLDAVTVVYDALGRGVEKRATVNPPSYTPIIYTPSGEKFATLVAYPGNPSYYVYRAYVPLPGGAAAVYGNYSYSLQFYRHPDWLGSGRLETNPTGSGQDRIHQDVAYAPYGEDYAKLGETYDLSFTGQTQDEISVTYDFLFRDYSAITGRWYSPDPAGLKAADPANPQTWNRYAYVGNNPLSFTDPLGLCIAIEREGYPTPMFCGIPSPPPPPPPSEPGAPPPDAGPGVTHGPWENGETLGLPKGLNLRPASLLDLLGLSPAAPGTGCDFGVCVPIGSGFQAGEIALSGGAIGIGICAATPGCQEVLVLAGLTLLTVATVDTATEIAREVKCSRQYTRDKNKCKNLSQPNDVKSRCYASAATRYGECLAKGSPSSPLITE